MPGAVSSGKRILRRCLTYVLILSILLAQIVMINPVVHAADFTITPRAVKLSEIQAQTITITSDSGTFTPDGVTPYLYNEAGENAGALFNNDSIVSTDSSVSFILLPDNLSEGVYTVRLVDSDPSKGVSGVYANAGTIRIGDPEIIDISPGSVANGYDQQVSITVEANNTNFVSGQSSVEILSGDTAVTNAVGSITSVDSTTGSSLIFTLNTGLESGVYSVKVTTGTEEVAAQNALTVRGTPSVSISPSSVNEGYSNTTITVTGINTGFDEQTTVSIMDGEDSKANVGTVTAISQNSLTFQLTSGLAASEDEDKSYTVKVKTGAEEAEAAITVKKPSADLQNLDNISQGYSSTYTATFKGINTGFVQGTTQLSMLDAQDNDITGEYLSNISVADSETINFTLGTGLQAGTYTVNAETGSQTVASTFTITSPTISSLDFSSSSVVAAGTTSLPKGYKKFAAKIEGNNTLFSSGTTVKIYSGDSDTNKTSNIIILDAANLSFDIETGLEPASYTVKVDIAGDGSTILQTGFTITSPSIVSVSPGSFVISDSTPRTITVTGSNTHFSSTTPTVALYEYDGSENRVEIDAEISDITVSNGSNTVLTFKLAPNSVPSAKAYGIIVETDSTAIDEEITLDEAIAVNSSGIQSITPGSLYIYQLGSQSITVTTAGTNFSSDNTEVFLNDSTQAITASINATQVSFTPPSSLGAGTHTVRIAQTLDEQTTNYTTTFIVSRPSVSLSDSSAVYGYTTPTAVTITALDGITFVNTTNEKPTVNIIGGSSDENDIATTFINSGSISFPFPTGLSAGDYTINITWGESSSYPDLTLSYPFEVTNEISRLYIKSNGSAASSVSVAQGAGSFNLQAWGDIIEPGAADQNKTSGAAWNITTANNVVSVSKSGDNAVVTILKAGTETIRASYDGQNADVNITVLPASASLKNTDSTVFSSIDQGYSSEKSLVFKGTNTGFSESTQLTLYSGDPDNGGTAVSPSKISTVTYVNSTTVNLTLATGLPAGTYYIKAVTTGSTAVKTSFAVNQTAPQTPTGLAAASQSTSSIGLSWNASATATGYKIYRSASLGGTYTLKSSPASTSYTDTGLASGTAYYYKISAVNAVGESAQSSALTTATTAVYAPVASNVTVSGELCEGEALTGSYSYYDAEGDAESGTTFKWYRADSADGSYQVIAGQTAVSYTLTAGDVGKYIKFEVTPKTTAAPAAGTAVKSSALGPVAEDVDEAPPLPAVVSGVTEEQTYTEDVTPEWVDSEGTSSTYSLTRNGEEDTEYTKGSAVTEDGSYELTVTVTKTANGLTAETTVSFTIDKTPPAVTGVANSGVYTASVSAAFAEGTAVLSKDGAQSIEYVSGTAIAANGSYVLEVTDAAGNKVTISFTINIPSAEEDTGDTGHTGNAGQDEHDSSAGSAGASSSTPTPTPAPTPVPTPVPTSGPESGIGASGSVDSGINDLQNASTDDGLGKALDNASELVKGLGDNLARAFSAEEKQAAMQKTVSLLGAASEAVNKITNTDEAVNKAKDIIKSTAGVIKSSEAEGASTRDVEQALLEMVNRTVEKVNVNSFQAAVADNKASVVIDTAAAEQMMTKLDTIKKTVDALNAELLSSKADIKAEAALEIRVGVEQEVKESVAELPVLLLNAAADKKIEKIAIDTGIAKISIAPDAIPASGSHSVSLSARKIDTSELSEEVRAAAAGSIVFDFNASAGSKKITSFNKPVEVAVPYTLKSGEDARKVTVFYIDDSGKLENVIGVYDAAAKAVKFTTTHFSKYIVKVNNRTFNDIADVQWAKEAIEVIAAKGIIDGVGNDRYSPSENVTRAQFAALLVRAFKLQDANAACSFSDVRENDWFYSEVSSAVKAGLIEGRGDGTFAPDEYITRQDMAVLIARVLIKLKNKSASETMDKYTARFNDKSEIAQYARGAAAINVKYGIINGVSDDTFAPLMNATRAQAAVVMYKVFQ